VSPRPSIYRMSLHSPLVTGLVAVQDGRLVEIGLKAKGKVDGGAFVDRIGALADDRGRRFYSDGLFWSCVWDEQGSREFRTACVLRTKK